MSALTASPSPAIHGVLELRQYTLRPGRRDRLIELFDGHFVDGQEAHGMRVVGQFRQSGHPDRFVWLRSFQDMPARAAALKGFYSSPVWQAHRNAANATMIDSDNVLLLKAAWPTSGFASDITARPGGLTANIVYLRKPADETFLQFFEGEVGSELTKIGEELLAFFVTSDAPNDFPALPVRDATAFVWFSRTDTDADRFSSPSWRELMGRLSVWSDQPIETLRLEPTARSRLR